MKLSYPHHNTRKKIVSSKPSIGRRGSKKTSAFEEITTEEFDNPSFKKPIGHKMSIDKMMSIRYTDKRNKHKEFIEMVKKESVKQSKNLFKEAKLVVVGISNLAFVVAESIAAYVLYFSGNTLSLKIVAGVLVVDASIRACKQFVNR